MKKKWSFIILLFFALLIPLVVFFISSLRKTPSSSVLQTAPAVITGERSSSQHSSSLWNNKFPLAMPNYVVTYDVTKKQFSAKIIVDPTIPTPEADQIALRKQEVIQAITAQGVDPHKYVIVWVIITAPGAAVDNHL